VIEPVSASNQIVPVAGSSVAPTTLPRDESHGTFTDKFTARLPGSRRDSVIPCPLMSKNQTPPSPTAKGWNSCTRMGVIVPVDTSIRTGPAPFWDSSLILDGGLRLMLDLPGATCPIPSSPVDESS
jgi:hypothetical protein